MSASPRTWSSGFSGLLGVDEFGRLVPESAWHWQSDATARRWSFSIRPDLCAPGTGGRITAHSFETLWRVVAARPRAGGLPAAQCRAVDSWKLVVLLDEPDPELPHRIGRSGLAMDIVHLDGGCRPGPPGTP